MKPTTSMFLALLGAIAIVFLGHWYLLPLATWVMVFGFGCGLETGRRESEKLISVLTGRIRALIKCLNERIAIDRCGKGAPDVRTHNSVN